MEKAIKIKINNAKKGDNLKDKNIVQKIKIRNQINLYLLCVKFKAIIYIYKYIYIYRLCMGVII